MIFLMIPVMDFWTTLMSSFQNPSPSPKLWLRRRKSPRPNPQVLLQAGVEPLLLLLLLGEALGEDVVELLPKLVVVELSVLQPPPNNPRFNSRTLLMIQVMIHLLPNEHPKKLMLVPSMLNQSLFFIDFFIDFFY